MALERFPILDMVDPEELAEKIIECNANLNKVAKFYNVSVDNLKRAIAKTPMLEQAYQDGRYNFGETFLDGSENVMIYLMNNVKQDPKHAFMAAKFVLENLGHIRGYGQKIQNTPENQTYIGVAKEADTIREMYQTNKKVGNAPIE